MAHPLAPGEADQIFAGAGLHNQIHNTGMVADALAPRGAQRLRSTSGRSMTPRAATPRRT